MKPGTAPMVGQLIDMALEEDLGRDDVTTRLCVPDDAVTTGRVIARQSLVVSGLEVFTEVMNRVDSDTRVTPACRDADAISSGDIMATVMGRTSSLLMAERVALNFLQRLCGTATTTADYVSRVPAGCEVRLVDTRKTTPGMRNLERAAVRHGGGMNHRQDLGGGILIKENHIAAAGSVYQAVCRCKTHGPHPLKVEVEVTNEAELDEALRAHADVIMLDNMTPKRIRACLVQIDGRAVVEASGGINRDTVAEFAATGVDVISVGAFTHSAAAADISFLIEASV